MSDPRPPPQSTVQAAGHVAQDVVQGLQQQPMMLAVVIMNIVGIGAALWFLSEIAEASNARWQVLMEACLPRIEQSRALLGDF